MSPPPKKNMATKLEGGVGGSKALMARLLKKNHFFYGFPNLVFICELYLWRDGVGGRSPCLQSASTCSTPLRRRS